MPSTVKQQRTKRNIGRLTPDEAGALLNTDICPVCGRPRVLRRPWREDWYCGWCRAVCKLVGKALHFVGYQSDLDRAEKRTKHKGE